MRRTLVAVVVAALLGIGVVPGGSPPAQAAGVVVVNGFDYDAAPLWFAESNCGGGSSAPGVGALYRAGGARGTHATGLDFSGTDWSAGALALISTPLSAQSVTISTLHPSAPVNGAAHDGYFVLRYDPTGANFANGYYAAFLPLNADGTGWTPSPNVLAAPVTWYFWNGTSYSGPQATTTLAAFAASKGTNGSGAWVGFQFGCDGRDYYMDDLRLTTSAGTTTYDFESNPTRSYISSYPTHHSETLVRDITRIPLVYGQDHYLFGDSEGRSDGIAFDPPLAAGLVDYIPGTAVLYQRRYGSSTWQVVGSDSYTATSYGLFHVRPGRQTLYQIRTAPTWAGFEASASKVLTVTVRRRVRARALDTTIRKGQRITVAGRILPGDRGVVIALQRRTTSGWRTLVRSRTGSDGRFTISHRTGSTGRWTVRVKVVTARGLIGNVSPNLTVRVLRAVAPTPQPSPVVVNPVPITHDPIGDVKEPSTHHRTGSQTLGGPSGVPGPAGPP